LLRSLATFEVIGDFLDSVSERAALHGSSDGRPLHRALVDALAAGDPEVDYYRHHPWSDDGGYLRVLVRTCRSACRQLPGYGLVLPLAREAAGSVGVQALNHEPDPASRDAALRAWATRRSGPADVSWFERTAAASAWLTVLALLAIAARPGCERSLPD